MKRTFQNSRSPRPSPERDISLGDLGPKVSRQRSVLILVLSETFHLSSLGIPNGGVEHFWSVTVFLECTYLTVLRSLLLLLPLFV